MAKKEVERLEQLSHPLAIQQIHEIASKRWAETETFQWSDLLRPTTLVKRYRYEVGGMLVGIGFGVIFPVLVPPHPATASFHNNLMFIAVDLSFDAMMGGLMGYVVRSFVDDRRLSRRVTTG